MRKLITATPLTVALLLPALNASMIKPVAAQADTRTYTAGNSMLVVDGISFGWLKESSGGTVRAEVINERVGATPFTKKHIGTPSYEDISVKVGLGMNKTLYNWIADSWSMKFVRKNGSVIATNYKMEALSEREFMNALITETTIPAMDGSSKEPAYITVKISPETTRLKKSAGKPVPSDKAGDSKSLWLPSNFRLEIDGLDCSKVSKIDGFTIKQPIITSAVGDQRDFAKEPVRIDFPNLRITMSESAADNWISWHEDFVIKGLNTEDKEKKGKLVFLSTDRRTELGQIEFLNLGIISVAPNPIEAGAEGVRRVTAELYCEQMKFIPGK